jgi:L,D-peptidoglycan transpeptidase YkuD (ErfK/YbiS/YcfS/YnhG family)
MNLFVNGQGEASWRGRKLRCAFGHAGIATAKREGDGKTPAGSFPMRFLLYRSDRGPPPPTGLPLRPIGMEDGWCDAPEDPAYNRLVDLPYAAHAEALWRADALYDLVVPLGYNDMPVLPGMGSAIFLHLATPDFAPTAGCVALSRPDLIAVLLDADAATQVVITP